LLYELEFQFWGAINSTDYKFEKRPVGKFYFVFQKIDAPTRWRSLVKEGTPKPPTGRIWLELHQRYYHSLYSFEDDEIEDFEGHELVEPPPDVDAEDMAWLFPTRGPGEFKDKYKKKDDKKKKKKKKKSKV
jgi:hypothetical protein